MIANYFSKSKLRYYNSFWNASMPNEGRSSNCDRVAAKIARCNSVNSEIIGQKFTITNLCIM